MALLQPYCYDSRAIGRRGRVNRPWLAVVLLEKMMAMQSRDISSLFRKVNIVCLGTSPCHAYLLSCLPPVMFEMIQKRTQVRMNFRQFAA